MQKKLKPGIVNYPMPIALIGTNNQGKDNFMTDAWFSMVSHTPPMIAVTIGKKLSSDTIRETGVFSICIPSSRNMVKTDYCGIVSGDSVDKASLFTVFKGETGAPMIEECGINVECRLNHIDANGINETFIGDIVNIYADEKILTEGKVDFQRLSPLLLSQLDAKYYIATEKVGDAWNEGRKLIEKQD
jgi:flavin reductase (DIM6/NTAB) family NADH-FMN oxidoreductase RutF